MYFLCIFAYNVLLYKPQEMIKMENPVRNNVETMLDEEIESYLNLDPKGLYITGSEIALQFFSQEELKQLEQQLDYIDHTLLSLIFLIDENEVLSLDDSTKHLTDSIIVSKGKNGYIFIKNSQDGHPVMFDVIDKDHSSYPEFEYELSRFFKADMLDSASSVQSLPTNEKGYQKTFSHCE